MRPLNEMRDVLYARVSGERGSVGVLVALAIFFVLGMISMTFNTAVLSKEKMRLQNAADAAALEHASWQARGMNAIQNLNDEAFIGYEFSDELVAIAAAIETFRRGFEIAEKAALAIPVVGPALAGTFRVLEVMAHFMCKAVLWVSWWIAQVVVEKLIYYQQTVYMFTPTVGWLGAQQMAQINGAGPIGGSLFQANGFKFGFYTVGVAPSSGFKTAFKLPVERCQEPGAPFKMKKDKSRTFFYDFPSIKGRGQTYRSLDKIKDNDFKPLVSQKHKRQPKEPKWYEFELPAPTVWVCWKSSGYIKLLPLNVWDSGYDTAKDGSRAKKGRFPDGHGKLPIMFAIAAAQCITGDVVKFQETAEAGKVNNRPAGFGTGATAKLVPVSDTLPGVGALIYH